MKLQANRIQCNPSRDWVAIKKEYPLTFCYGTKFSILRDLVIPSKFSLCKEYAINLPILHTSINYLSYWLKNNSLQLFRNTAIVNSIAGSVLWHKTLLILCFVHFFVGFFFLEKRLLLAPQILQESSHLL